MDGAVKLVNTVAAAAVAETVDATAAAAADVALGAAEMAETSEGATGAIQDLANGLGDANPENAVQEQDVQARGDRVNDYVSENMKLWNENNPKPDAVKDLKGYEAWMSNQALEIQRLEAEGNLHEDMMVWESKNAMPEEGTPEYNQWVKDREAHKNELQKSAAERTKDKKDLSLEEQIKSLNEQLSTPESQA